MATGDKETFSIEEGDFGLFFLVESFVYESLLRQQEGI